MWCVHTFHKLYIVMQHIYRKHEQLPHSVTSSLWLIFDLGISQYYEMLIGNSIVLLLKHSKVVIAIFSNGPYSEIASDSIKCYD